MSESTDTDSRLRLSVFSLFACAAGRGDTVVVTKVRLEGIRNSSDANDIALWVFNEIAQSYICLIPPELYIES